MPFGATPADKISSISHFRVWQIYLASACLGLIFFVYCYIEESSGFVFAFALAVTFAMANFVVFLTKRLLFSISLIGLIDLAIILISDLRRSRDNMTLHSWDVVLFVKQPLSMAAPMEIALGALALLISSVLLIFIFKRDRPIVKRFWSAPILVLGLIAVAGTSILMPERSQTQYFWNDLHLSNFYRSLNETAEVLLRRGLILAAEAPPLQPMADPAHIEQSNRDQQTAVDKFNCTPAPQPVHIILIHEESVMVPDIFPDLDFDHGLLNFYESDDRKIHRLRVETYGGASWLTQFSIFTGASTHAYGSIRNFVQVFSAGKLAQSIPQILSTCGYRNIMFTPWSKSFMSMARFYESIGFGQIDDMKVQGNQRENERDRFFFTNALNRIDEHLTKSHQPLFLYIETMSAHWPFDEVYMPEIDVKGGGPDTPPQMSEYLRRLAMVKMDDEFLRSELSRRFPNEKFLIFRYGDHHPIATMPLLGEFKAIYAEDTHFPIDSPAFFTFFASNGLGYQPPALPDLAMIDVPYLGAILLQSAGLPLPYLWQKRLDLMQQCEGLFWSCPDHQAILDFNRQLINAKNINEE